jgi:IS30 family transposase
MNKSSRWASPVFSARLRWCEHGALVPGHWEGDLIIGKGNLSQVGTLAERTSLFVALAKLNSGKTEGF